MADIETMDDMLLTLTADIVAAHVSNNSVAVNDLPNLIQNVHQALAGISSGRMFGYYYRQMLSLALLQPEYAALSAAWFWSSNGLNELADAGQFEAITRRINGGLNGQPERLKLWAKASAVLSAGADAAIL